MEEVMSHAPSMRSNLSGLRFNLREIHEEHNEIVYVAVEKEVQKWMKNLMWLLKSINRNMLIVFLHVHQPSKLIETPLGPMRPDVLGPQMVNAYRKLEEKNMNECLNKYVRICSQNNFKAITISVENDDIAVGLLQVIKLYKVTNLIMGAGSAMNLCFWRNSRAIEQKPKSKIAKIVRANAESTCRIRFIRKGELICIREPIQNDPAASNLSRSSSCSSPDHFMQIRSQSMPPSQTEQTIGPSGFNHKSTSFNVASGASFPTGSSNPTFHSGLGDPCTGRSSCSSSHQNFFSDVDSQISDVDSSLRTTPLNYSPSVSQNVTIASLFFAPIPARLEEPMPKAEKLEDISVKQRDISLRGARQLKRNNSNFILLNCTKFTYSEINEATENFDLSRKIGQGGCGAVYKGFLRHTRVAIKVLNCDSFQGDQQFFQEIEILSQIRHPHLVTLIGVCLEARALVYEYLPGGSLDKYLTYKGNNRLLPWQDRVRVAVEICSALIFLHLEDVAHGDLKPENVLLDSNFTVKLSDFGISRKLHKTNVTTTPHHITDHPKGTIPYIDPEYMKFGELTPWCDVFSFGIVLLQLVTGSVAVGLRDKIKDAEKCNKIEKIVDTLAGWPLEQAKKMIQIGLCCSNESRKKRPDLGKVVWGELKSIANFTSALEH